MLYSDSRIHQNPTVIGFNPIVGSAPQWYQTFASGGFFCLNQSHATVATGGGTGQTCYRLTVTSDQRQDSINVSGNGFASFSTGAGAYSDDSTIYLEFKKICPLPVQEAIHYTITLNF